MREMQKEKSDALSDACQAQGESEPPQPLVQKKNHQE